MSTVLSFPAGESARTTSAGDWSRQELADLYRVEALLIQANMRIETDRGTTDEGEPWFVFCRPDGDVFVHLCRIDGMYLLDSPGLDQPLRGSDFAGLIDQFVRGVAARAATSNVVQLRKMRPDSVVRLHPGVMMAALIWSLYLASDHLMEAAHAAEASLDDDTGLASPVALSEADALELMDALDAQIAAEVDAAVSGEAAPLPPVRAVADGQRDTQMDTTRGSFSFGMASGSFAAALTAIAATFGLHSVTQSAMDAEATELTATATTELLRLDVAPEETVVVAEHERGDIVTHAYSVKDMIEPHLLVADATLPTDLVLLTPNLIDTMPTFAEPVAITLPPKAAPAVTVFTLPADAQVSAKVKPETSETAVRNGTFEDVLTLASAQLDTSKTFTLQGKDFFSTFDLKMLVAPGATDGNKGTVGDLVIELVTETELLPIDPPALTPKDDDATTPPGPAQPAAGGGAAPSPTNNAPAKPSQPDFTYYDLRAQNFIAEFVRKAGKLEIVHSETNLMLIDRTALDEVTDQFAYRTWIVDDGITITAIGHYADFLQNGMLVY